jgi:drug/metabolite transporter (DMT)-like permease
VTIGNEEPGSWRWATFTLDTRNITEHAAGTDSHEVNSDPLGLVTASLFVDAVALLPAAVITPPGTLTLALGAIAVLGALCTALGLIVFFHLIAEAGPARASVITCVNRLVAVVAGASFEASGWLPPRRLTGADPGRIMDLHRGTHPTLSTLMVTLSYVMSR